MNWWWSGGRVGSLFFVVGLELLLLAVQQRWLLPLLIWPATSFLVAAAIYFARQPRWFGKQPTGQLNYGSTCVLLPFLLAVWSVWHAVRQLSREPAINQVGVNLSLGRRLLPHELPAHIDLVVDLTCEFREPLPFPNHPRYCSFPILDAGAPPPAELLDLIQFLAQQPGHLFIHCAQGHGRSGLVATTLLIYRQEVSSLDEALNRIRAHRPGVRLNRTQMQCAERTINLMAR
jgi:hypothetical protein